MNQPDGGCLKARQTESHATGVKTARLVADAIMRDIVALGWPSGVSLGTEASLMEQYAVSRATLREAIRALERHGAATMQAGVGLLIAAPARVTVVHALGNYIELLNAQAGEILDARVAIATTTAGLAARRINDEEIIQLRQALAEYTALDGAARLQPYNKISQLIIQAAGNPVLAVLLDAVHLFRRDIVQVADIWGSDSSSPEFVEAIVAGDEHRAREETRKRLESERGYFTALLESSASGDDAAAASNPDKPRRQKLGNEISLLIASDIVKSGRKTGDHLGTEAALQRQYKVSRATIREALSMLECHGVVHRRRGFGGGLIAGFPDPAYTVSAAIGFFHFLRLSPDHVSEARFAVEPEVAARAAAEASTASLVALREKLDGCRSASPGDLERGREFHTLLADASGSRIMSLFTQLLMNAFYVMPPETVSADFLRQLYESHSRILDAVTARDPALARRRMLEHLEWAARCMRAGLISV